MVDVHDVRLALSLDLFHVLTQADFEAEVRRLDEKHRRYLLCMNETTERVNQRIEQIKIFLRDTPDETATCSGSPASELETCRRIHTGTLL